MTEITCKPCGGTRGEHVGFDCPEDPTRPPPRELLAVLPSPLCELCGVAFDPNVPPQTCAGQPCLVPENEIVDWVVRVRGMPTSASPIGCWPSKELTGGLLGEQALSLARIVAELADDLGSQLTAAQRAPGVRGVQLVPQLGPYCPSYLRRTPALVLSVADLELMQRAWLSTVRKELLHRDWRASARPAHELAELDAVWARVAKHLLELVCHRLQDEFR